MTPTRSPVHIGLLSPSGAGSGAHYSGPGTNSSRMYRHLRPERGRVSLLHAADGQRPGEPFASTVRVASTSSTWPFAVGASRTIRARRDEFDVLHVLSGFARVLAPALWSEGLGVPTVVKIIADDTELEPGHGTIRRLARALRRRGLHHVSAVIAISDEIAERLRHLRIDDERIARIPNGVDVELFQPIVGAPGDRPRPRIVLAGSITERKRAHLAVDALGHPALADVELHLVGPEHDVAYSTRLRRQAVHLGVAERLRFRGMVTDMPGLYRSADVVVLPSRSEGMANSILEAMACAVPFVVTPSSGMRELAATGGGLLVEDPRDLAEAIAEALRHRDRLGAAGRSAVVERYDVRVILERHLELFDRVRDAS